MLMNKLKSMSASLYSYFPSAGNAIWQFLKSYDRTFIFRVKGKIPHINSIYEAVYQAHDFNSPTKIISIYYTYNNLNELN